MTQRRPQQIVNQRSFEMRLALCVALIPLLSLVNGFQLSMVASRAPFGRYDSMSSKSSQSSFSLAPPPVSGGVTSGLISQLAVAALKLRLRGQDHVSCDVIASSSDVLLRGQVGPVTVKGRGWQSRLGLTCRAIEATVDRCDLDVGRILSHRKLLLTTPAKGNAMIAFNAVDFGNFITHPYMRPPGLPEITGVDSKAASLQFLKEGIFVDPASAGVAFFGTYLDAKWKFVMQRALNGSGVRVTATPCEVSEDGGLDLDSVAPKLASTTEKFFNEMVFELDGTFLSFRDMMVTGKGKEPTVMLALSILVRKFPSAGLEF